MPEQIITEYLIESFLVHLVQEEKSKGTVQSYRRGLKKLIVFAGEKNWIET